MRVGIALLIVLPFLSFGQKKGSPAGLPGSTPTTPLFTFRNESVLTDEFIYLYKKNHLLPTDYTEEKIDEYITLFVNFKLKVTEARSRGMDTTKAFIKEYNTYKEELKRPYLANSDDLSRLTQQVYDRLKEEVKASHLLILVKQNATPSDTLAAYKKIQDLRERIVRGKEFGDLAKEFSEDPTAKQNNGNLGYFTSMQMVYPFEEAVYNTPVGSISPIIRTHYGYHIIKVTDRRPARGEVEVSHILLRTDKADPKKVKNSIFEIYDQLKGGRGWNEVCKEYSEDTNSKESGGLLKPFGVGTFSSVPEFENAAFSLKEPGEISDPFQSNVGWHIVRLEKKIPLPSYKELEPSLKRKVARDERLTIAKTKSLELRKKEMGYAPHADVIGKVLMLADSGLIRGKWNGKGRELSSETLFELDSQKVSAGDFLKFVSTHAGYSTLSPEAYMHQLIDRFVEEKINESDEKKLAAQNPEFRMLLTEYREGILLFEIMEKEVWKKASEDTIGQKKYYSDHLDKFKAGNRVEAKIYGTRDKTFRDEAMRKILAGDTLQPAEMKKFNSVTSKRIYKPKESQVIDAVNWVPGLQSADINGTYYLVEIDRLVPPGTMSLGEAKATVISEYQEALEKRWVAELRKKYGVKINKNGRKIVMAALKNENIAK